MAAGDALPRPCRSATRASSPPTRRSMCLARGAPSPNYAMRPTTSSPTSTLAPPTSSLSGPALARALGRRRSPRSPPISPVGSLGLHARFRGFSSAQVYDGNAGASSALLWCLTLVTGCCYQRMLLVWWQPGHEPLGQTPNPSAGLPVGLWLGTLASLAHRCHLSYQCTSKGLVGLH